MDSKYLKNLENVESGLQNLDPALQIPENFGFEIFLK